MCSVQAVGFLWGHFCGKLCCAWKQALGFASQMQHGALVRAVSSGLRPLLGICHFRAPSNVPLVSVGTLWGCPLKQECMLPVHQTSAVGRGRCSMAGVIHITALNYAHTPLNGQSGYNPKCFGLPTNLSSWCSHWQYGLQQGFYHIFNLPWPPAAVNVDGDGWSSRL